MVKCYLKNIPLWNDKDGTFKSSPINADDLNYLIENLETFIIHLTFNEKYTGENNAPVYNLAMGGDSDYQTSRTVLSVQQLLGYAIHEITLLLKQNPDNEKLQTVSNILYSLIQRFKGAE